MKPLQDANGEWDMEHYSPVNRLATTARRLCELARFDAYRTSWLGRKQNKTFTIERDGEDRFTMTMKDGSRAERTGSGITYTVNLPVEEEGLDYSGDTLRISGKYGNHRPIAEQDLRPGHANGRMEEVLVYCWNQQTELGEVRDREAWSAVQREWKASREEVNEIMKGIA